ncbi:Condensin-2 complex subunit D3 Non-SMC condensin II complex subunit D3 [Larimichthys crocea]|uniref:Condensin-2 complex subunit D3 n=1 Tax=Larimichthys crocea TaxID=215358 RepID=A0A6G0HM51_LARCR|nr:Condensin-2 complex subunit D3 Non-SMC condensin II complex subunit D3 [Larimichthys crocea]
MRPVSSGLIQNKMDLISALQFLKLGEIPQAWVDEVWDLEFTQRKPFDDTIEEALSASKDKSFRTLYQCLLTHAADQQKFADSDGASQSIWATLGENRVSIKSLVAVLSFFVLAGKAKAANVQQRVNGLHAASVYLLLLGIPGSIINQVFHEVLLDTCSNLTSLCWPQDSGKKRKKDGLKSSQAEGKRSKPQRKDASEEDEEEEEELHFSGQDLMKIRDAVVLLVQSLLRLLQTFPLKDRPQSASNCTEIFTKLLYFEQVIGKLTFAAVQDISKLRSVPEMAFYGLQLLCLPKHGDQKDSLRRIFHRLLYVILMMNKGSRGKPSLLICSQAILSTRDQAVHFICYLVEELKEVALPFLQILLQHICYQMVEKSEFRSHGAQTVGLLTSQMASKDYACFIKWLSNFSIHSKMVSRLFSVDVVMVLLEQPEREQEECEDADLACFLPHKFLIQNLLFARRMDSSPTVQSHTLACLAQCLELPSLNATRAVHNLFSATGTMLVNETTEASVSSQQTQKTYRTLPFRTVEITSTDGSSCDAKENLALLMRHVNDSKTNVRKSALQALVGLLKHDVIPMSSENLATLSERCRDPAVSVKKKALQCVGEMLAAKPDCSVVQKAWLQGVVPAVMDSESSVQDKALEALDQVLLSQVKPYSASRHLDASQSLTWSLLGLLCHECQNLSRYFSRAFTLWSKQKKFTPTFITNLISHTEADHGAGAWLLLSKVAASSSKLPYEKILGAWDNMISSKNVTETTCCHILCVMGDMATHLNQDTKDRIVDDLMTWLKTFTLSLEVICAAVETLFQFGRSEDIKQTQAFMNQHCGELVSICEAYLAPIILTEKGAQNLNEDLMVKHLHTLGVASLHCPAKVGKRTVLLVESVLTTHRDKLTENEEELPASLPLSQFKINSMPTKVRAHGVITLGKLCLQHEELVQKYLPVFARELEVGTEVAVRNNVVVIMCDLCVRYTNIVDNYIPNISACLRDSEAVIREQTLIMLTNLLQEEFVKWKGSLFFRFMVALVDPVPAIASLCEYCLLHLLLKKNPEMFSQHFIECIFHFNSYNKHKSYNKFPQSEREKVRFSLKGSQHRDKRFRIYRFLLEQFTDAQRFNITNKINQTVLACFADEELPLDAEGAEILSETFSILSLKEMKLQAVSSAAGGAAGEEPEEENMATMAKAVLQAAKKKVVSQVQKKVFIENTVPLIISLKSLLEQKRSPVLRDLMAYLQVTMQDYRNEVKEFFSGDELLAAEVEFALKTAEKERKMAEQMEEQMEHCSLTGDARTPTAQRSVQNSPVKSRPLLPFVFGTPQPRHPNPQSARLSHTEGRVGRSRQGEPVQSKSMALEGTVMPKGAVNDRAISTPKDVNINLTFDEGLSAIFSDQGTSAVRESSVLHVRSNEQQTPGLRQWNVQSPLRQKKKSSEV